MKDDISVFWRCNRKVFVHVTIFSVCACAALFFFDISIRALLILGVVLMWFVAVTIAKYRYEPTAVNNSQSSDVELEIWQDLEPTWATNVVVVISVLIFWLVFFGAVYIKYKSLSPLEFFV